MSYTLETIKLTISDLDTLDIKDASVPPIWHILSGLVGAKNILDVTEQTTLNNLEQLSEQNQKEFATLLLCCYAAYLQQHHAIQLAAHLSMTKEYLRPD